MDRLQPSGIRRVFTRAGELEQAGRKIVHFEIGRPDFDTPAPIKAAAVKALEEGQVHYTLSRGIIELRKAIASDAASRLGLAVDPEREVMVTAGSSNAILISLLTVLQPGDELLVPEPMYLFYLDWGELMGARTRAVPLRPENGFQLSAEDLRAGLTDRTKVILINSPHNPTGAGLSPASLEAVAQVARERDLLVISDEVYDRIVYPPHVHLSPASLPGMRERTIVVNSFSKPFAMDGWRVGWLIAPEGLVDDLENTQHRCVMNVTSFAQYGALEALRLGEEVVAPMVEEYRARRDLILDLLQEAPEIKSFPPQGAFYVWLDVSSFARDDLELAEMILEEAGVAITPGRVFGPSGLGRLRLSYAVSREEIELGLKRIFKVLRSLK